MTAPEYLPKTAMVLAAGLGTRMRPLTDTMPKPLIKVGGKPLIDHTLDRFAGAGVPKAVVNVHYFAGMVEAHLQSRVNPAITISDERAQLLETGGGLKHASTLLGDAPVFCANTDAIIIDGPGAEPCRRLAAAWRPDEMDALLLLVPKPNATGFDGKGDFDLNAGGHLAWRQGDEAEFIFTGLQIIKMSLLDDAPSGPFSTKLLWDRAMARGAFRGVLHDGRWMHVGDPAGLALANAWFAKEHPVENPGRVGVAE